MEALLMMTMESLLIEAMLGTLKTNILTTLTAA
jgi:hypothetical protein